ncbi:MAG TPA: bifunctional precorrin-2 dehydrogenase/sirohydrochlorin ferrochelatase [Dinghuibacter sp.]|jgi:siroheme synthase-like protein|uniref:precorrin-2 dehydrogenase/sirohydrochlorin ferrochelatase family protein n=1 Tax=Dinghuibacter sp. TaxID=2024697 RepID=UPI002CD7CB85|nr:bifunctional precorrin-2 dehydrogenase/sirohydrochlorin ferrochelatase [Dinghuibacter sp.]HTJ14403.1 bifunctional precorrin-2 dehydrogenase/sirohydrochlorin ferrochelatase [Dinghuibacter sp.]
MSNNLFPIFVKLDQVGTLLVGGGKVGLEKANAVLANDPSARLTVVASAVSPDLQALLAAHPQVSVFERPFAPEDLDGKQLVICATGDATVNEVIRGECRRRGILLNVADTPDLCDFYLSSVVRKGNLKIAISTNGKSPTMAKRLRELFSEIFPDETDDLLLRLNALRDRMKGDLPEKIRQLDNLTRSLLESRNTSDDLP